MRLLKKHRGLNVHLYLDGVRFEGVLLDVAADSVSLGAVDVVTETGSAELPGPVVVATASIVWAAVVS